MKAPVQGTPDRQSDGQTDLPSFTEAAWRDDERVGPPRRGTLTLPSTPPLPTMGSSSPPSRTPQTCSSSSSGWHEPLLLPSREPGTSRASLAVGFPRHLSRLAHLPLLPIFPLSLGSAKLLGVERSLSFLLSSRVEGGEERGGRGGISPVLRGPNGGGALGVRMDPHCMGKVPVSPVLGYHPLHGGFQESSKRHGEKSASEGDLWLELGRRAGMLWLLS